MRMMSVDVCNMLILGRVAIPHWAGGLDVRKLLELFL